MKIHIDSQLPPALAGWLRHRRNDATHVFDIQLAVASDIEIAALAERTGAVLVSTDDDFLALRLPARFPFVWLRCGNATNLALFAWLQPRWYEIERLLEAGELMVEVR
jgi:predicted nuclease of predicted toxin-antitoxin system